MMNQKKDHPCQEELDQLHHYLIEQITHVCVEEEQERMKKEHGIPSEKI
ncbi:hypothetical protein LS684_11565 [Cytobacillus spongiae]|nr:hypothetical protein [Cytobacillus spongiae]UII54325.1 hypothetical protein LS684_11565 [Cytobacillus spongiae]